MPIRMDLSNVKSDFELIEDGNYPATVYDIEETVTKGGKSPGTPMLKVTYKLQDGSNRNVWDNIVLNAASAWKFKQLCVAAGIPDDRLGENAEIETRELKGAPVVISVGHREATQQYAASNIVQKVVNTEQAAAAAPSTVAGWDD